MRTLNAAPSPLVKAGLAAAFCALVVGCDQDRQSPSTSGQGTAPTETSPTAPSPSVGTSIDDTAITARVKSAFVADPEVKSMDIAVETRKGEVLLSGYVDNQTQIDRATDIASRTQGVTGVQNKLAIKSQGTTVGSAVDDTLVTARVKTALMRDDQVKASDISVHTSMGAVQLSGFVESQSQIARATDLARAIEGVKSVDNKMALKH